MVYHGSDKELTTSVPLAGMVAASFLIGGFYPITQVYQHDSDGKDGVRTISMMLGKRGTFIFCGLMYAVALAILFIYYSQLQQFSYFMVLQIFFLPVLVFYFIWVSKVWRNETLADFKHTMQMNWLASSCTSLAFITLLILHQLG
jgi:1,4-dihydroxy-2-naphthoate octaprenyltransferase